VILERRRGIHTEFDTIVSKEESRQDHLSHAKSRAKCREETDRHDTQDIDEEDGQESIDKTQLEDWNRQSADSER
jgi:hypothetical protein